MSERRKYEPKAERVRAKEWVSLDAGDVCVWEMTVMEVMTLLEKASRPQIPGAPPEFSGGIDKNEEILWKIIVSTYDGDEPTSKPIWGADADSMRQVFGLRLNEFKELAAAMARVNGVDADRLETLDAFTVPSEGGNPSPSFASASAS